MAIIIILHGGTVLTQGICSRKEPFILPRTSLPPDSHNTSRSALILFGEWKIWAGSCCNFQKRESSVCWCMAWHSTEPRACAFQEVMLELTSVLSYKSRELLCTVSQRSSCLPVRALVWVRWCQSCPCLCSHSRQGLRCQKYSFYRVCLMTIVTEWSGHSGKWF